MGVWRGVVLPPSALSVQVEDGEGRNKTEKGGVEGEGASAARCGLYRHGCVERATAATRGSRGPETCVALRRYVRVGSERRGHVEWSREPT
jgi:hypothetical protein